MDKREVFGILFIIFTFLQRDVILFCAVVFRLIERAKKKGGGEGIKDEKGEG